MVSDLSVLPEEHFNIRNLSAKYARIVRAVPLQYTIPNTGMALIPEPPVNDRGRTVNNINKDGQIRAPFLKEFNFITQISKLIREGIFYFVNFEVRLYFCKTLV